MSSRIRLAIVSPDPLDNSQGVERFCHTLKDSVESHSIDAVVLDKSSLADREFDVVLTNALISVSTKLPRIHVYHGCHIPQIMRSHAEATFRWRAKFLVEAAFREIRAGIGAHRVSVSNSCAAEVRRWYGLGSYVIPNGIDTDVFTASDRQHSRSKLGLPQNERIALFVGRPEWRKRPDIAIAAARANGYELYLAAGRPYDGMTWLGKLAPDELALAISAADVVLMPTQYEACSLALLEALSVGTPVITTNAGWVPDLVASVPDYAGLVSRIGDINEFSRQLANIKPNQTGTEQARLFVREHNSLQSFGKAWAEYIRHCLAS